MECGLQGGKVRIGILAGESLSGVEGQDRINVARARAPIMISWGLIEEEREEMDCMAELVGI